VFKRWQRMAPERARALGEAAARHTICGPGATFPAWYFERWHFLPEGYLSTRSARLYDGLVRRLYTLGRQGHADRLVAAVLAGRRVRSVLELGCGSGRLLERLATMLPDASLTGIDLSPYLLDLAAQRLRGRAALHHADAAALPFASGSFDAVVACHVLGHIPGSAARQVLRSARRVVKRGGLLVVVDHSWHRLAADGWHRCGGRSLAAGAIRLRLFEAPAGGRW
jgi:SAM-dependent methyltransferase